MQKAEKMNEFSGSAEQKLPGDAPVDPGVELPAKAIRSSHAASRTDSSDTAANGSSAPTLASLENGTPLNSIAAQWPSPTRSLERAHDLMLLHTMRLRQSSTDTLQVVIKPGLGLQLSLNLQLRNGGVEMQALLQRGNYEFMKLHWPELQQQLETRGIRLGELAAEQTAGGDTNRFQAPNRDSSKEQTAGAFSEFALNPTLVPAPTATPKNRPISPRGWESWA